MIEAAIFAYNEEKYITRAIESLRSESEIGRITVLVNGCTDQTLDLVSDLASGDEHIRIIQIDPGDKCNVWNHYVHDLADLNSEMHVFMDGDCHCAPGSIYHMAKCLSAQSSATAVAAVPQSGRHRRRYIQLQHQLGWLFGNLYGVAGHQIRRLREYSLRLPIGLKGNDHFITRLCKLLCPTFIVGKAARWLSVNKPVTSSIACNPSGHPT